MPACWLWAPNTRWKPVWWISSRICRLRSYKGKPIDFESDERHLSKEQGTGHRAGGARLVQCAAAIDDYLALEYAERQGHRRRHRQLSRLLHHSDQSPGLHRIDDTAGCGGLRRG